MTHFEVPAIGRAHSMQGRPLGKAHSGEPSKDTYPQITQISADFFFEEKEEWILILKKIIFTAPACLNDIGLPGNAIASPKHPDSFLAEFCLEKTGDRWSHCAGWDRRELCGQALP